MASLEGSIMEDPTGQPPGQSMSRAVLARTPMEEGIPGQAIFGGLALIALAHEATTSGHGRATADGDTATFVRIDLSAAVTPKQ